MKRLFHRKLPLAAVPGDGPRYRIKREPLFIRVPNSAPDSHQA
jgi:hypothetical protein